MSSEEPRGPYVYQREGAGERFKFAIGGPYVPPALCDARFEYRETAQEAVEVIRLLVSIRGMGHRRGRGVRG